MIELLAPAKDKKCAKIAIDFGADAIYIGASEFGARKKVGNSIEDIKEVIEYAHKFNVKVYAAINTILSNDEVLRAEKLIKKLAEIGIDAIIIQDMGLLEIVKSNNIYPHASTQCDNRTPEKIKFLQSVGFSRAILARELSIKQIKEIKKQTDIELETFIHGALCVSYSGQCYLSYLIGGRSANRGECAQPCRKKYSLIDEEGNYIAKDKYLLNLKDFNASKYIQKLTEAGITSFKIEGRLKDENYVKNVVGYYRKLIDDLGYKKTSSGQVLFDFEPKLEKSFNRGFTDYFLEKRQECYSFLSPKSIGEYIGKVKKISGNFFEVSLLPLTPNPSPARGEGSNIKLNPQDGLCFYDGEELSGCLINKIEGNKIYPNKIGKIKIGTEIYRNIDSEFEKKLKNSKTCRKIGVDISFDLKKIQAIDEDNNSVEINYNFEELAQNSEKMKENIINQFKKSGDSDSTIGNVEIKTEKIPFLPVSKLNELRRELLEKLMQERLKNYQKTLFKPHFSHSSQALNQPKVLMIDYKSNVLNKYAKEFYEKQGCEVKEMALESGIPKTGKKAMTTKHCLKYAFDMCKSSKKLYLVDEKGKRYELKFNCKDCEMEILF